MVFGHGCCFRPSKCRARTSSGVGMTPLALLNVLLILVTLSLAGFAAWAARRHLLP
jgi:hypothetical protein